MYVHHHQFVQACMRLYSSIGRSLAKFDGASLPVDRKQQQQQQLQQQQSVVEESATTAAATTTASAAAAAVAEVSLS